MDEDQFCRFRKYRALHGYFERRKQPLADNRLDLTDPLGRKSVGDQFKYSFAPGERGHMLYFATFNNSFAVAGVSAVDRSIWLEDQADKFPIYTPGDFQDDQRPYLMRPREI
jgi:hypothetical protein